MMDWSSALLGSWCAFPLGSLLQGLWGWDRRAVWFPILWRLLKITSKNRTHPFHSKRKEGKWGAKLYPTPALQQHVPRGARCALNGLKVDSGPILPTAPQALVSRFWSLNWFCFWSCLPYYLSDEAIMNITFDNQMRSILILSKHSDHLATYYCYCYLKHRTEF